MARRRIKHNAELRVRLCRLAHPEPLPQHLHPRPLVPLGFGFFLGALDVALAEFVPQIVVKVHALLHVAIRLQQVDACPLLRPLLRRGIRQQCGQRSNRGGDLFAGEFGFHGCLSSGTSQIHIRVRRKVGEQFYQLADGHADPLAIFFARRARLRAGADFGFGLWANTLSTTASNGSRFGIFVQINSL